MIRVKALCLMLALSQLKTLKLANFWKLIPRKIPSAKNFPN